MSPHHIIPPVSWTVQTPSQRQLTLVTPLPSVEDFHRPSWSNLFLGWLLTDLIMPDLFVPTCTCGNTAFFFLSLWYLTPWCTKESNYTPHLFWQVLQAQLFQSLWNRQFIPLVIFLCTCSSWEFITLVYSVEEIPHLKDSSCSHFTLNKETLLLINAPRPHYPVQDITWGISTGARSS